MHNDSKLIYEAFVKSRPANYEDQLDRREAYKSSLLRKDESNKSVFLLINDTQYEFDVYGIYSTREMAEQKMAEFGKDKNLAVLERPLDSEPNFYYSDSQYGEEN